MLSSCSTWCWSFWLAIVLNMCLFLSPSTRLLMACHAQCTSNVKFPALFAFGDSIVDPGNNNDFTYLRCDWPPYGKDFVGKKATGRFSNGRIPGDFMAERLGIKNYIPAYSDKSLKEEDLLTGVSFASGGSGYDRVTCLSTLSKTQDHQLKWFKEYIGKIKTMVGVDRTNFIVNNSAYFLVSGNNDLAITYLTVPFARKRHDDDSYTDLMLDGALSWVENLYKMGARTIGVSNIGPLGYLPFLRTLGGGLSRRVVEKNNDVAALFNRKLRAGLDQLSFKLYKSNLIYIDIYNFFLDLVVKKTEYGFQNIDRGCCGSGLIEVAMLCNPFCQVCDDTKKFLFWDSFHPTERAYELLVDQIVVNYFPHYLS